MLWYAKTFPTPKESTPWVNKLKYIIVHHSWTKHGTINWVLNWLANKDDYASAHYVVDIDWSRYKIGNDTDILWHAGKSEWWTDKDLNTMAIWIEVIWWMWEDFPFNQRSYTKELIQDLMFKYNIPRENVLRHADITWSWSKNKVLWDWVSQARKIDIDKKFYINKYKDWSEYQKSLIPLKY